MKPMTPRCRNCRHYYITWDADFPYGCRAMGFKSRTSPEAEVRRAMRGKPCLMFSKKTAGEEGRRAQSPG